MPIDENLQRELNKLASSKLTGYSIADSLMFMMRKADNLTQYSNFLAFMKNTIVVDGKLHNVREYYRNSAEYAKRYDTNVSENDRKKMEANFDTKIRELLD